MSALPVLVAIGDEHVGPFLRVWSAEPASPATRLSPQVLETLLDAIYWAAARLGTALSTRDWPWIRCADGRVLSPAYLRSYAKAMRL